MSRRPVLLLLAALCLTVAFPVAAQGATAAGPRAAPAATAKAASAAPRPKLTVAASAAPGRRVSVTAQLSGPRAKLRPVSRLKARIQRRSGKKWKAVQTVAARNAKGGRRSFVAGFTVPGNKPQVRLRVAVFRGKAKRPLAASEAKLTLITATPVTPGPQPQPPAAQHPAAPLTPPAKPAPVLPGQVVTSETTTALSAPAQGDGQLVLDGEREYRPGSYLAFGITDQTPDGLLSEVVSSTTAGGQTTLQVTPAALSDVVPAGALTVALPEITAGEDGEPVARRAASPIEWSCSAGAEASIGPSFSVSLQPVLDVSWSPLGGTKASIITTARLGGGVSAQAAAKAKCEVKWTIINDRKLPRIQFLVAGVPVVVQPELGVGATFSLEGVLKGGKIALTADITSEVGARWDGDWQRVNNTTRRAGLTIDGPSVSATANAHFQPDIKFLLYGAVGPKLSVFADLTAKTNEPGKWGVDASIGAQGALTIPKLKFDQTFAKWTATWPLVAQTTVPYTKPQDEEAPGTDPLTPLDPAEITRATGQWQGSTWDWTVDIAESEPGILQVVNRRPTQFENGCTAGTDLVVVDGLTFSTSRSQWEGFVVGSSDCSSFSYTRRAALRIVDSSPGQTRLILAWSSADRDGDYNVTPQIDADGSVPSLTTGPEIDDIIRFERLDFGRTETGR